MKLGFLYAGQGSQHPGMGADLYEAYPAFRQVLDAAQAEVDFDLRRTSFEDPEGVLNQTRYTQPCMVAFAAGLTAVLRDEWGFDGIVMTDWGTTAQEGNDGRKYKASTCAGCIRAGNDLIMPGSREDFDNLYEAICSGEVSAEQIRRSAGRILRTMTRLSV